MWQARDWQAQIDSPKRIHRHTLDRTTGAALHALDLKRGQKVLVAGCGYGREARLVLEREPGVELTAVDQSPDMVKAAGLNGIGAKVADVTALPFPDGSFDRVLCYGVLMHVEDDRKALSELARVTAKGGVLVWTFNNSRSPGGWAMRMVWKLRGTRPDVRQEFRPSGHWRGAVPQFDKVGGSAIPGIGPDWAYPLAVTVDRLASAFPRYETVARWQRP